MKQLKVRLTFTEGVLGTQSTDKEIYNNFIASKAPAGTDIDAELKAIDVDREIEKGTTVFAMTEDGEPALYDYQIKGFFKGSCGFLQRATGKDPETGKKKKAANESSKIKAYKKEIDGTIFVMPRMIPLILPEGEDITICQRPLRAQTAQGERVALASSEEAPAGTQIEFKILMLNEDLEPAVLEWLEYGQLNGIGQWHNSGKGRFETQIIG
ncbi:hypothetical protein [Roseburia hominis]|uniref:hypothetical protein n=1 Tax=Roseburia hominis TaxID=301301 RepID=UPI00242D7CF0|nr:hypothetical protein [Roseburia hominis]